MDIVIEFLRVIFLALLALSVIVGLLAVVSPSAFAAVATLGNRIIHPGRQTNVDRWIGIDRYVLEHGRMFGSLTIATVVFIWFVSSYGPEAYPKSFLMSVLCVALLMGILALCHILRQDQEIESHLAEAHTDALTDLPNRRAFDIELSRRLAQRQRQGTPLCLQIIDIDNFKSFNDACGHVQGDAILKKVASALMATARQMDIVARLGGDEFAVLLPGSDLQEASCAAERFRIAISASPLCYDGHEHGVTISSGVAEAQLDDDNASLLKRADSALYAAKEAGRNCSFRHGGPELATLDSAASQPSHESATICPASLTESITHAPMDADGLNLPLQD